MTMTATHPTHHSHDLDVATAPLLPALLLLYNGVDRPGTLVFAEYPEVHVELEGRLANALNALTFQWKRGCGQLPAFRGWINAQRLVSDFHGLVGRWIDDKTVGKYVAAIISKVTRTFQEHGEEPPALIEKDHRKGMRLVRELIVDNRAVHAAPGAPGAPAAHAAKLDLACEESGN